MENKFEDFLHLTNFLTKIFKEATALLDEKSIRANQNAIETALANSDYHFASKSSKYVDLNHYFEKHQGTYYNELLCHALIFSPDKINEIKAAHKSLLKAMSHFVHKRFSYIRNGQTEMLPNIDFKQREYLFVKYNKGFRAASKNINFEFSRITLSQHFDINQIMQVVHNFDAYPTEIDGIIKRIQVLNHLIVTEYYTDPLQDSSEVFDKITQNLKKTSQIDINAIKEFYKKHVHVRDIFPPPIEADYQEAFQQASIRQKEMKELFEKDHQLKFSTPIKHHYIGIPKNITNKWDKKKQQLIGKEKPAPTPNSLKNLFEKIFGDVRQASQLKIHNIFQAYHSYHFPEKMCDIPYNINRELPDKYEKIITKKNPAEYFLERIQSKVRFSTLAFRFREMLIRNDFRHHDIMSKSILESEEADEFSDSIDTKRSRTLFLSFKKKIETSKSYYDTLDNYVQLINQQTDKLNVLDKQHSNLKYALKSCVSVISENINYSINNPGNVGVFTNPKAAELSYKNIENIFIEEIQADLYFFEHVLKWWHIVATSESDEFNKYKPLITEPEIVVYKEPKSSQACKQIYQDIQNYFRSVSKKIQKAYEISSYEIDYTREPLEEVNIPENINLLKQKAYRTVISLQIPEQDVFGTFEYNYESLFTQQIMLQDIDNSLTEDKLNELNKHYKDAIVKKEKQKREYEQSLQDSSSSNTPQNSLIENIDKPKEDKQPYETIETDYLKRLAKENKKRAQKLLEHSQKRLQNEMQKRGQSSIPKQNFIYNPFESKPINDFFFQKTHSNVLLKSFKITPLQLSHILQTTYAQGNVIQLNIPFEQTHQASFSIIGKDGSMRISGGGSGTHTPPPRGLLKSGPGADQSRFMRVAQQLKGLLSSHAKGKIINGPGFAQPTGRANIVQGPGAIPPMPIAGRIAGGYIGVFIVLPQVSNDLSVIASPKTNMIEKGSAFVDLGVMAGTMLAFTKFVANKYPKTAAVIMVGTAGKHAWECTQPFLKELEKGQRGMTVFFVDEKAMLKAGMSCTDGRKVEFLNPAAAKYIPIKPTN